MASVTMLRPQAGKDNLCKALKEYFQAQGWRYETLEAGELFRLQFAFPDGTCTSFAHVPGESRLIFESLIDPRVPEGRRPAVAELVVRLNRTLFLGHFDLEYDNGTVSYSTTMDLADGELTTGMLAALILANLSTVQNYFGAIMNVVFGGASAGEALSIVEL